MSKWQLVDFTHSFPEWNKIKKELNNKKRIKLNYSDFFSINKQVPFNFTNQHIQNTKEIFNFYYANR